MEEFNGDANAVGVIVGNLEPSVLQQVYRQHGDEVRKRAIEYPAPLVVESTNKDAYRNGQEGGSRWQKDFQKTSSGGLRNVARP